MTKQQCAVDQAERWLLIQFATFGRETKKQVHLREIENATYEQQMLEAGADADWADCRDAALISVPSRALRNEMLLNEEIWICELARMSSKELEVEARENMKAYAHSWPRPNDADMRLTIIDSRIQSTKSCGAFYDQFRNDSAKTQNTILAKLVEESHRSALIFDFLHELFERLKAGRNFQYKIHGPSEADFHTIKKPKGTPGPRPTVRDNIYLSLVQRVRYEFKIPLERADRSRRDSAKRLVADVMDKVLPVVRGPDGQTLRYGIGLTDSASDKIWERHRAKQKGN